MNRADDIIKRVCLNQGACLFRRCMRLSNLYARAQCNLLAIHFLCGKNILLFGCQIRHNGSSGSEWFDFFLITNKIYRPRCKVGCLYAVFAKKFNMLGKSQDADAFLYGMLYMVYDRSGFRIIRILGMGVQIQNHSVVPHFFKQYSYYTARRPETQARHV